MENNKIDDEGAEIIAEVVKTHKALEIIMLGNNCIGSEGAIVIAEAIKYNKSLSEIHLEYK